MNRTIGCMILGLCVVFSSPVMAAGVLRPKPHTQQPKEPTAEPVSLQGVVHSVTAKRIEVLVDKPTDADKKGGEDKTPTDADKKDGENKKPTDADKKTPHGTWSVIVPNDLPVQVTGEATPDYLHHGLMVRFTVQGKEQGATETVHQLTIVTAASHKAHHKGSTASNPADTNPVSQKEEAGRTVIGQLGHLHNNQWSVMANGKTRHIELADDVKIDVAYTGSHFVSPGDKIVVQGEMIRGKPGTCTASSVQVTLAKPLDVSKDSQKKHKSESEDKSS